jgi:hypothetical protein
MKKNTLKNFCEKTMEMNKEMHDALVEMVNKNGGIVRTNIDRTHHRFPIYGFIFDEEIETTVEHPIVAVATWENGTVLGVLFDFTDGNTTYENESDEEVLESDDWVTIFGGMVLENATLYNLCENLWQYAK